MEIVNQSQDGLDKILDRQLRDLIQQEGRSILKNIFNQPIKNEKLVFAHLHVDRPVSIEYLMDKIGFNRKKLNRILLRLDEKQLIKRNGDGWLRLNREDD